MSNITDCPKCGEAIDVTAVALGGFCPECDTSFVELVEIASGGQPDPEDAGPFYEVDR